MSSDRDHDIRCQIPNFQGKILFPQDEAYIKVCTLYNAAIDKKPLIIAQCSSVEDVRLAIAHAQTHNLPLSVRGGGHHIAGFALAHNGVTLDLSPMVRVTVDPSAQTCRIEGGAVWGDVDPVTQAHGLAVTGGRISRTGVVGQALQSGSGWLERALGLTSDSVTAVEMVTASRKLMRASSTENQELFWAARGCANNFGVVTAMETRLHKIGPEVLAGLMVYPSEAGVVQMYRDFLPTMSMQFGSGLIFTTAPPLPFIPQEMHGKKVIAVVVFHFGDRDAANAEVQRFRNVRAPVGEHVGWQTYVSAQRMIDEMDAHGTRGYWKNDAMTELSDQTIANMIRIHSEFPTPQTFMVMEPKGGAIAKVSEDAMAVGGRAIAYNAFIFTQWLDAADDQRCIQWAHESYKTLQLGKEEMVRVGQANFMSELPAQRMLAIYGREKYERLLKLKRELDPQNVFRSNANIDPTAQI